MKIVELATTACTCLNEIDTLTSNKQYADSIEATHKELQEILKLAEEINSSYQLFQKRLKIQEIQQRELPNVLKEIRNLQLQFTNGQNLWQVVELRQTILPPLKKIQTKITTEWKKDVDNRLNPHLELLKFVQLLPEIRVNEAKINHLTARLQTYKEVMPTTQNHLDDFEQCLAQLKSHLAQLESLHEDVLQFLKKTYNHKATMVDVTEEVLRWCHLGEHAKIFHISISE